MSTVLANWPVQPEEADLITELWPAGWEVVYGPDHADARLIERASEFDVIAGQLGPDLLAAARGLRLVHVLGHGIDRLGQGEVARMLRARNLPIARANPAAGTISEFVIMSLVALNRRLIRIHEALALRGDWSHDLLPDRLRGSLGGELDGASLCIAGLGDIGQAIAAKGRAFGMHVTALTRDPARYDAAALGVDAVGALDAPEAHLAGADHLVLALPLTGETEQFLDRARIAAMKPGSYLVNISRAAIVDTEAMTEALRSGQLAGAAIDVWPDEAARTYPNPYPIHHFNVIMTPHYCAITRESRVRALKAVGENLTRLADGQPLRNASNVDGVPFQQPPA